MDRLDADEVRLCDASLGDGDERQLLVPLVDGRTAED